VYHFPKKSNTILNLANTEPMACTEVSWGNTINKNHKKQIERNTRVKKIKGYLLLWEIFHVSDVI